MSVLHSADAPPAVARDGTVPLVPVTLKIAKRTHYGEGYAILGNVRL